MKPPFEDTEDIPDFLKGFAAPKKSDFQKKMEELSKKMKEVKK
jgi:hypothetical protein